MRSKSISSGSFARCGRKLIVSVTLLPMLVHSILGCCWHHAHSEVQAQCASIRRLNHMLVIDTLTIIRTENNDPVVPAPCEHDESCDDVRCVYLAAEPVRNALAFDLHEQVAALDCCCFLILNATVTASRKLATSHRKCPLPSQHCADPGLGRLKDCRPSCHDGCL